MHREKESSDLQSHLRLPALRCRCRYRKIATFHSRHCGILDISIRFHQRGLALSTAAVCLSRCKLICSALAPLTPVIMKGDPADYYSQAIYSWLAGWVPGAEMPDMAPEHAGMQLFPLSNDSKSSSASPYQFITIR